MEHSVEESQQKMWLPLHPGIRLKGIYSTYTLLHKCVMYLFEKIYAHLLSLQLWDQKPGYGSNPSVQQQMSG